MSLVGEFSERLEAYDLDYRILADDRDALVRLVRLLVDGVRAEVHPAARGRLATAIEQAEKALRKHGGV